MERKRYDPEFDEDLELEEEETEGIAPEPKKKKVKWWQITLASLAGLVLLLTLSLAVWWSIAGVGSFEEGWKMTKDLFIPRENNLYYKDSYTVDEKKAQKNRDKVVATIGDRELTNGVLQIYYWMNIYDFLENYGYYAVLQGLDYTQPLDQQNHPENDGTWQHFFLEEALNGWQAYQAMSLLAQKEGITLSEELQESLDSLRETMASSAVQGGFSSIDAMIQSDMGPGCTYEDYYEYTKTYFEGYMYYTTMYDKIDSSQAAIDAYFEKNEATLKEAGITKDSGNRYDVRHILIEIEGGTEDEDGEIVYSDEDWENCRVKAQELLDQWLAGDHTEETFAELAKEHSADGGSKEDGGLYTDLDKDTTFVEEFVNWYMDENRQVGDYGLIKTSYGYHIMYCSGIEAKWIEDTRQQLLTDAYAEILKAAVEAYPIEVNYKKIVLGEVDLGA